MGVDGLWWASRTSNPLVGALRCLRGVRLPPAPAIIMAKTTLIQGILPAD